MRKRLDDRQKKPYSSVSYVNMSVVVGICGASGSGKTTLAQHVQNRFQCKLIHQDSFYKVEIISLYSITLLSFSVLPRLLLTHTRAILNWLQIMYPTEI